MSEAIEAARWLPRLWNAVAGYPLWLKILVVVAAVGLGLIVIRLLQGEGAD